jgi:hypothetical protein
LAAKIGAQIFNLRLAVFKDWPSAKSREFFPCIQIPYPFVVLADAVRGLIPGGTNGRGTNRSTNKTKENL